MFRRVFVVALALLPFAVVALPVQAQVALKKKEDPTFIVAEIDETSMIILQADQFETARKELEDAYKAELERYKIAKKKQPDLKEPERKKIAIVGNGFKDRQAAQEHIEKLLEKKAAKAAVPKKKPRDKDK